MKPSKINKFFTRFLFVFLVHLIIKIGDQSFTGFFDASARGIVFSVFFITYWMIVWYLAELLNGIILKKQNGFYKSKKKSIYVLFTFNFTFGLVASFIANALYRFGDIHIFHNGAAWSSVTVINPELTFSLLSIYMMVFTFDVLYQSKIKMKEDELKMEQLQKESMLARYLNLKSQIEPHFLFNSLSVLSSLIYSDADLASEFVLRLSRILRYVIEKNKFLLVSLQEEMDFVHDYLFLMQTRFDQEIICTEEIEPKRLKTCFVPPTAMQTLVENAIKHNKFTKNRPLRIILSNDDKYLIIKNNLQLRSVTADSTKHGLDSLKARYSHFTFTPVEIAQTKDAFTVLLPLLTKEHYERFNI